MGMTVQVVLLQMEGITTKNFTYLVKKTGEPQCLIVDPTGDIGVIESALVKNDAYVSDILVTHTHYDHISLVASLVERYHCRVWVSNLESSAINVSGEYLYPIQDESTFMAASLNVTPVLTPGHTFGSICYLISDNFFTGDTLFIEGCGMCFGSESDPYKLFDSLNRLKKNILPSTKIFPAHSFGEFPGRPFYFLLENNIYLQFSEDQKELFVSFRMRNNQTKLFDFR